MSKFQLEMKEIELKKQADLIKAINETEEKERGRISDELHDSVGAKLTVIKYSLEYLKFQTDLSIEDSQVIQNLNRYLDETITEVRDITHNLNPSNLAKHGFKNALENLVVQFNKFGSCQYSISIDELIPTLVNQVPMIYRISSELLQNIHKHSRASIASIQVVYEEGICKIIAEDNGIGFSKEALDGYSNGIGMDNIKNKVNSYDGVLNIDSSVNGTTIIIELNFNSK